MPSGHCRHCDKSFDQIRDLALHMMNVHAEFGRNILGCMVANCGYTYKNMNYLREYIGVTHTNYQENKDYVKVDGRETLTNTRRHIFTSHSEPTRYNSTLTNPENAVASTSRMNNSDR